MNDAAPQILVRRLYFTLTGLPPTPSEVSQWTKQLSTTDVHVPRNPPRADGRRHRSYVLDQDAITTLVDKLLASPRYGERWGRHWMDVARFAESTGGDQNNIYQNTWRYRDYVIDSFNEDKPFDQFIR